VRDSLNTIRELLAANLPWSPHDYLPGISRRGDRRIYAEQLAAELPEADDFRIKFDTSGELSLGVFAERLPWDSEFFGFGVVRLNAVFPLSSPWFRPHTDYRGAVEQLLTLARQRDVRYIFAQVEPRDLATIRALGELGFALIETRFFHHGPVLPPGPREPLPVRLAVESDIPSLAKAAAQTVNPYDRFHADPFIEPACAARLMERWVEESVCGRLADLVLVPDVHEPGAFVTFRFHRSFWPRWGIQAAQGILSAVAPDFMGWMGRLGPEINAYLQNAGVQQSFGSTQVTNRPVIWFAQEAGARFGRCEYIFRRILD
jgi:dTDP-4-amino-4,6-dideoxy-D-galactose acyltransferase